MSAAHTSPALSLTLQWGDWSNAIQDSQTLIRKSTQFFFKLGVKTGKLEKIVDRLSLYRSNALAFSRRRVPQAPNCLENLSTLEIRDRF